MCRGVKESRSCWCQSAASVPSTVRATDGRVVPVKTSRTIPKERMFDLMKEINAVAVTLPAHIGDVVIADVLGTGADVVVTANIE